MLATTKLKCAWCNTKVVCERGCIVLCQSCSKNIFVHKPYTMNVPGYINTPGYYSTSGNLNAPPQECWCGGKNGQHIYGLGGHGPELGE